MSYIIIILWIVISLIVGVLTKSFVYFSYAILYGCLIIVFSYSVKWIKNGITYSLYRFHSIDGIIIGTGKTKVTAYSRRLGWFMKGTVLKAFFVEYNYLVIEDSNGQLVNVLISEVNQNTINELTDNCLDKQIKLKITKYNDNYFIEKEFWKKLNFY